MGLSSSEENERCCQCIFEMLNWKKVFISPDEERAVWIQRLWVPVPLGVRHPLFPQNIHSSVENECCFRIRISSVTFINKTLYLSFCFFWSVRPPISTLTYLFSIQGSIYERVILATVVDGPLAQTVKWLTFRVQGTWVPLCQSSEVCLCLNSYTLSIHIYTNITKWPFLSISTAHSFW